MIEAKEYDVVLTKSGIEATIIEKYDSEPLYYAQRSDDDELISLKSDEIKKIIFKA
ncbi:hypothetical protein FH508_0004060 [Lysinibacillus sp. CD3-6]|uniref:hypothetical protein n=1 Tax=Lysinibacillus sp. CD3-6 TaxID=2892541 RepID=UPI001D178507|nr:hypothetical protein [Lysinibacillus sp. CD3-6]UED81073.1 hypothetical protein FH508_0004060 [Lysinibacillus sp. CD3-6]